MLAATALASGGRRRRRRSGVVLKRNVAIARLTNETKYGAGLFADTHDDRLGKRAPDIPEPTDRAKLGAENELMGLIRVACHAGGYVLTSKSPG